MKKKHCDNESNRPVSPVPQLHLVIMAYYLFGVSYMGGATPVMKTCKGSARD